MDTAAFDYELPPDRIAQAPLEPRDAARLLVDRGPDHAPDHRHVRDLADLLAPGDVLVMNDTRVLPARLRLRRPTGGAAEVLLLERHGDGWEALVRPSARIRPGTVLTAAATSTHEGGDVDGSVAIVVEDDLGGGRRLVRFSGLPTDAATGGPDRTAELEVIEAVGELPLPPYLSTRLEDPERYQTVYARRPASAAAPTAGLHLTPELLGRLFDAGVLLAHVELVVGLDTFRPIATDAVEDHRMHSEGYRVPPETMDLCREVRARGGSVVAVGTTVVRALESAAARGELAGRTDLFIRGDHPFAVVDRLLTNFHLPRSSLLVLIDAFVGPRWRSLYEVALDEGYRFLSFGDAMLLTRGGGRA